MQVHISEAVKVILDQIIDSTNIYNLKKQITFLNNCGDGGVTIYCKNIHIPT